MNRFPRAAVSWLGRVPYPEALHLQESLVGTRLAGEGEDTLLLLEHPHVYTMGRRARTENLIWNEAERSAHQVDLVWVDRGGDVTYHGPGQLVGYPILDLAPLGLDVLQYVERLEDVLIAYLAELGIEARRGGPGLTGVWAGEAKVAAIGVHRSRSVVSHGFALNLATQPEYWAGIVGCGLPGRRTTSVAELLGAAPDTQAAAREVARHFATRFGLDLHEVPPAALKALLTSSAG